MNILTMAGILSTLGAGLVAASMHFGAAMADPGVVYAGGGIGMEERAVMESARGEFNLRLIFASKRSGAYRADVGVEIRKLSDARAATGQVMLKLENTGPLLYTSLPPGRYAVHAQSGGMPQVRQVALPGQGARELVFYWDE